MDRPRHLRRALAGGEFDSGKRGRVDNPLTISWPSIGSEDVVWDVQPRAGMTRRERAMIGRTYRAAITAPIADLDPILSAQSLAAADEAAAALARFDEQMGHRLAPYAAILLRSEAASSSRIEGISSGARAVMEAEVTGGGRGNAAEVYANTLALRAALDCADGVTDDSIRMMHRHLLGTAAPDIAGHWRDEQVWIGADNSPQTADFVPPAPQRVPAALADLFAYTEREDWPVVAQVAVAHAQFETIHPFTDGNGRVGRALMHVMLRDKGVTRNAAVPVSSGLLVRQSSYVAALTSYRAGDPDAIVMEVSRACLEAAEHGRNLVEATAAIRQRWAHEMRSVRADSAAHRLADGLIGQPVVTVKEVREILGTKDNVHRHIDTLVARGVLVPGQDYRTRNLTWRAPDVLDALDNYSEAVGRRSH